MDPWSGFRSEAAEALAIVALFVGVGLGGAALAGGAYPAEAMDEETSEARLWLVDGFNVLHAAVLTGRDRKEWWRGPARSRVREQAGGVPAAAAEIAEEVQAEWVRREGDLALRRYLDELRERADVRVAESLP